MASADSEESLSALKKARSVVRTKVTIQTNKLNNYDFRDRGLDWIASMSSSLTNLKNSLSHYDEKIEGLVDSDGIDKELEEVSTYTFTIEDHLGNLSKAASELKETSSNREVIRTETVNPLKIPMPSIQLGSFSDNTSDPFSYLNFKREFQAITATLPSLNNSQKLLLLRSHLKGDARRHLEVVEFGEDDLERAWELLDLHFLDPKRIINITLEKVVNCPSLKTPDDIDKFISSLEIKLHDLSMIGQCFAKQDSPGLMLLSVIVRKKLPNYYLQELVRKTGSAFPDVNELIQNRRDINSVLQIKPSYPETNKPAPSLSSNAPKKSENSTQSHSKTTSGNKLVSKTPSSCRLCEGVHVATKCDKYLSLESRRKRASNLNLCSQCLSPKHSVEACPGKEAKLSYKCFICKKPEHHAALCPDLINSSSTQSKSVLTNLTNEGEGFSPVIEVSLRRNGKFIRVPVLLDTGAQISVVDSNLCLENFGKWEASTPITVTSFSNAKIKGSPIELDIMLPSSESVTKTILATRNLSLPYRAPPQSSLNFMNDNNYYVSPNLPHERSHIKGILGLDVLHHFNVFSFENININSQKIRVLRLSNGYIPVSSVSPAPSHAMGSRQTSKPENTPGDSLKVPKNPPSSSQGILKRGEPPSKKEGAITILKRPKRVEWEIPKGSNPFIGGEAAPDIESPSAFPKLLESQLRPPPREKGVHSAIFVNPLYLQTGIPPRPASLKLF